MASAYRRPVVEWDKDITEGSERPSVPPNMAYEDSPQACSSGPMISTRRHSDLPRGSRPMQDRTWGSSSDGDKEGKEGPKTNHPRPGSFLHPSGDRKHASVGPNADMAAVAPTLHSRRRSPAEADKRSRSPPTFRAQPHALSFLDPDSPDLSPESVKRTLEASTQRHRDPRSTPPRSSVGPSSTSTTSTRQGRSRSGCGSDHDSSKAHMGPESSIGGDIVSTTFVQDLSSVQHVELPRSDAKPAAVRKRHPKNKEYVYGTPEMPRGNANLPHLPPDALTPRVPNPGQGHVKHLPRAEKLPLTGYELLAARLSTSSGRAAKSHRFRRHQNQSPQPPSPVLSASSTSGDINGRPSTRSPSPDEQPELKPIYRRFEALNHRLLLHLQDELSELEEQLHRLDTADTQTRRLQNCILPASRRAGHASGGELQWHKTDTLGKIGFKLGQYNHALSSFREVQELSEPDLRDVEAYRTYLATESPIAEMETRFLDPTDDLVLLARGRACGSCGRRRRDGSRSRSRSRSGSSDSSSSSYGRRKGDYSPAAMSDEAPTPRQWFLQPKTTRFPAFVGAPGGDAFLPTPSLSPASSVAGSGLGCSRPSTSEGVDEGEKQSISWPAGFLPPSRLLYLLLGVFILLPVLLLRIVEGVTARMAVVLLLMAVSYVLGQILAMTGRQGRYWPLLGLKRREVAMFVGVYGAVIAVLAAVC